MLWFNFLLLTLFIAAVAFFPLLRSRHSQRAVLQQDLNKAFYYDRLQEIQQDNEQGLLDNPQQSEHELQQRLLNDIPQTHTIPRRHQVKNGKMWFASATILLATIALLSYFSVGSWHSENMLEQARNELPHLQQRLTEESQNPLTTDELRRFIIALRADLQQNPENHPNWWLLGQIAMANSNGQLALDSYKRATLLQPENNEYQLSYARVLMFSQDENDKLRGELLLREVIKQNHNNVQALSLLAFNAFEKEDYKMAVMSWEMMLRQLPANDERVPLIQRSMAHAIEALKQQAIKQE